MLPEGFTQENRPARWQRSVYLALVRSLLLVMALFSLSRVLFYLFNTSFFPDMTLARFARILWGGLHFDLTAVLYTNILFIVLLILPFDIRFRPAYRKAVRWVFYLSNGIALAFNTADIIYYRFTLRRTSANLFSQFQNETNLGLLFLKFLVDYWYVTLLFIFLMVLLVRGYRRIRYEGPLIRNRWAYYLSGLLAIPATAILFVGGVRGDFRYSTRPITLSNAGEYVSVPRDMHIVLNTPFAIYRTLQKPVMSKLYFYRDEQELERRYSPVHPPDTLGFRARNVVVIILESFGREYFGVFNRDLDSGRYRGFTPFLDSLAGVSRSYPYAYANGRKSIDAIPSVLTGLPSVEMPYVLGPYSSDRLNSIASLLKGKGYQTAFFHGAPNGSMGFNALVNIIGYDRYYGKTEYEAERGSDDFDGFWGIWDEPFLDYMADRLNTFRQPFHAAVFTTSSHHPYSIPEKYHDAFPGGTMSIYKTIQYADHALRLFFEKAGKMPWFKNTLFVITADHCSAQVNYDQYRTAAGYFWVPLLFFAPDDTTAGMQTAVAQQTDILPSVMGYLRYDAPYVAFGSNLYDPGQEPFAFNFLDDMYQLFEGDYLLLFDGTRATALYRYRSDVLLKENLLGRFPEVERAMVQKVKAIVQQYNNRLIDDRLTSPAHP